MRRTIIRILSRSIAMVLVIALIVGIMFLVRFGTYVRLETGMTPVTALALLLDGESLLKTTDGRVNILLLGVGGGTHEGGDLTDTIIVASCLLSKKTLTLISIPRDLWSEDLKDKINSAYHYGEEKKKGGGITLAKAAVEDIVGIPMHYAMVYNFSEFQSFIDSVGGIDVAVPVSFIDTMYPIEGKENDECNGDGTYACRYETVSFKSGIEHMDGKRALTYVRSRHSEGDEGNDFARGRRQQEVMIAMKDKIIALRPWFHWNLAVDLFRRFDKATDMDMTVAQLLALGKIGLNIQTDTIQKVSFEQLLTDAPMWKYERYALEPIDEGYTAIQEFIKGALEKK